VTTSRKIVLEILRDGPPHNQLLSPLTRYLAKCQNRPAESLHLQIEHKDFLRWQAGLSYVGALWARRNGEAVTRAEQLAAWSVERRNAISDASEAVTNVFGSIRALIAELACEPCEWRHIHLIIDATELGALPFELASAAPGLMVEGEKLFAQQNARVTLTRQTHRVATSVVTWPNRPRILCVIGDGRLPADAHVLALRQAIDPWIGWNDGDTPAGVEKVEGDARAWGRPLAPRDHNRPQPVTPPTDDATRDRALVENRIQEAEQLLTVLENPTLEEVSTATSRSCFTHVHVLAHGAPLPGAHPGQTTYGLCFRSGSGEQQDVVDGDRLEAALRYPRDCGHPTVVTLATCEGANLSGGILGPGASVAHAVHSKGVPLVVASQFPLSKGGSVVATEMLYKAMLRGEDPRETLHAIRRELIVSYPATHDWASLVMYASLPTDLAAQLQRVQRVADKLAAEAAVERLSATLRGQRREDIWSLQDTAATNADESRRRLEPLKRRVTEDLDRLDRAVANVRRWTSGDHDVRTQIWAQRLLARLALWLSDAYVVPPAGGTPTGFRRLDQAPSGYLDRPVKHDFSTGQRAMSTYSPTELLTFAKDCYETAYWLDSSQTEIWVQVVALRGMTEDEDQGADEFENILLATRHMAWLRANRASNAKTLAGDERPLAAAIHFEAELMALLADHLVSWRPVGDVGGDSLAEDRAAMTRDGRLTVP